jgi:release factor glutamine methyltransferase
VIPLLDVLQRTERYFREHGVPSPRLDAELLLAHVLGTERLQLYLMYDRPMADDELERLRPLVKQRGADRVPLAYLTGERGFHRLDLAVRPGVLVPRPDTETLVDAALGWIGLPTAPVYVADVGCGTGAVGLSIAAACPEARVYAIDVSDTAIATTKENVARLGLADRVGVLKGSLLAPVPPARPIDWVVSNPPYIPTREIDGLMPEVARHEPREALDGGRDGLEVYRALIPAAKARARQGVLVEVGAGQAPDVAGLFEKAGFREITRWKDFGGHERVVGGRC